MPDPHATGSRAANEWRAGYDDGYRDGRSADPTRSRVRLQCMVCGRSFWAPETSTRWACSGECRRLADKNRRELASGEMLFESRTCRKCGKTGRYLDGAPSHNCHWCKSPLLRGVL